jgi:hypothetical protein
MAFDLELTVGVVFLLMIWTVLFKQTIIFRIATSIWIGSVTGIRVAEAVRNIYFKTLVPISGGDIAWVIPVLLGCLLFFRYSKKLRFIVRYPSAIMAGAATGVAIAGMAIAQLWAQALSTANITNVDSAIIAIWVVLIILYFILTVEHKGSFGYLTQAGRLALMMTFGAGTATYAIARFSQVIGRFQLILYTWLGLG